MKKKSKRPRKIEIDHDLQVIADLYLSGMTMREIGAKLGCSHQKVGANLKKIRKMWLESAIRDFDELKSRELAKIDRIERKAWEAWEKSCGERKSTTKEQIRKVLKAGDSPTAVREKLMVQTQNLIGDPRYLEVIARCIERRCKILGLDKTDELPKEKNVTFTLKFD